MNYQTERFNELVRTERKDRMIMQYFKENEKDIDIHAQNEQAFIYSCLHGHFEIVNLLIEKGVQNENTFIYSCSFGYLTIVKLLIEKGVNIHAQNEKAFIASCFYGHMEIVKLLCQKCKDYFVMIKNGRIYDSCIKDQNKFVICYPSLFRLKKICL